VLFRSAPRNPATKAVDMSAMPGLQPAALANPTKQYAVDQPRPVGTAVGDGMGTELTPYDPAIPA